MFKTDDKMKYYTKFIEEADEIIKDVDICSHSEFLKDEGRGKYVSYYNIACSFDLEASNILIDTKKLGTMWIWMVGLNGYLYYGRTYEEFVTLIRWIVRKFELDNYTRLRFYTHNLSYDFSFIKNWLNWDKIFSIDSRTPLYARTSYGIEFYDSYILAGCSLAEVAKKKCHKYPCKKMKGDLDYKVIRHSNTTLDENSKEFGYCQEDVRIICNYIQELIETEGEIYKIPLTKTGYVRRDVYENTSVKYKQYKKYIHNLTMDVDTFNNLISPAFRGGFTHEAIDKHNMTIKDVAHIDFTSSYPFCLINFMYPCSCPIPCSLNSFEDINIRRPEGYIFKVRFNAFKDKFKYDHYLSTSACKYYLHGVEISENDAKKKYLEHDNGRIVKVLNDDLIVETVITSIDAYIIKKTYDLSNGYEITDCVKFFMSYLPKELIQTILKYYELKSILDKDDPNRDYYKEMLNSIYGFICQSPFSENWKCEGGEWSRGDVDFETDMAKYNSKYKRTTYYPWACFCTAFGRANLWGLNPYMPNSYGIFQMGQDFCYTDTDSIFFKNKDKHIDGINKYNDSVKESLFNMCDELNIERSKVQPKGKLIGVWDWEDDIALFRAIRAKAYMCYIPTLKKENQIVIDEETGETTCLTFTVSGANKKVAIPWMLKEYGSVERCFEEFKDGMELPSSASGKLTPAYYDEEFEATIKDYLGNTMHIYERSCVHLYECTYKVKIDEDNLKLWASYQNIAKCNRGGY